MKNFLILVWVALGNVSVAWAGESPTVLPDFKKLDLAQLQSGTLKATTKRLAVCSARGLLEGTTYLLDLLPGVTLLPDFALALEDAPSVGQALEHVRQDPHRQELGGALGWVADRFEQQRLKRGVAPRSKSEIKQRLDFSSGQRNYDDAVASTREFSRRSREPDSLCGQATEAAKLWRDALVQRLSETKPPRQPFSVPAVSDQLQRVAPLTAPVAADDLTTRVARQVMADLAR